MGYCWKILDVAVLIAGPKPLLTEFEVFIGWRIVSYVIYLSLMIQLFEFGVRSHHEHWNTKPSAVHLFITKYLIQTLREITFLHRIQTCH